MDFNTRLPALVGQHAFLSASSYHWVNYDEDKLDRVYHAHRAAQQGSAMHALAYDLIRLGVKLPATSKSLNMYVNDAIGYRMTPEQLFYFSENCFGTADCASFKKNKLRVHDLKTGIIEASPKQLEVYAALFCLEYKFTPLMIEIELRIYQADEVRVYIPEPDSIFHIMDKIKTFDQRINYLKMEEL
jgi:hypothetical protein